MVRRIASQVHQQISRLLRADYIKQEPVWYQAVLDNPPITLPPKAPPSRSPYDTKELSSAKVRPHSIRPLPIYYLEDDIRRQFFMDHPFEAFRPATLVESEVVEDQNLIVGIHWTRLRQRGRNPTPEDAVQFTLNLFQYSGLTLSEAYTQAVSQFRALRSEHHVSTAFAVMEAEQLGSNFGLSEIEKIFKYEKASLSTWERKVEQDAGALAARKRWKARGWRYHGSDAWSKGERYVGLWQEGSRPNYLPRPPRSGEFKAKKDFDAMGLQKLNTY